MTGAAPIGLVIVEDHHIFMQGLVQALGKDPGVRVLATAGTARSGIDRILAERPAVALVDMNLPDADGISVIHAVKAAAPEVRCVVLTVDDSEETIMSALKAGAFGYLLKDILPGDLLARIREISRGEAQFDSRIASKFMHEFQRTESNQQLRAQVLTERERTIVTLIAQGHTNREISDALHYSERTVKRDISAIYEKLQVNHRAEAVLKAYRQRLFTTPPEGAGPEKP